MVLGISLLCSLNIGAIDTLTCEWVASERVDCVIETTWLGWVDLGEHQVHDVQSAYLRTGGRGGHNIILKGIAGEVVMNSYGATSVLEPKELIIDRINAFLKSPATSPLQEQYTDSNQEMMLPFIVATGIMFIFGLGIVMTSIVNLKNSFRDVLFSLKQTGGYAPGWHIRCLNCGKTKPAAQVGIIRIGGKASRKIKAQCSQCQTLVWVVLEPKPE